MNLPSIKYVEFLAIAMIVVPVFLISVTVLQPPEKKIKRAILRILSRKFRGVRQITETKFTGLPEYCGVNFYSTGDPDKIIVFQLFTNTSTRKIIKLIKEFLERKEFKVEFYNPRESDTLAIRAHKQNRKIYVGIMKGHKVPNSFMMRIES
jgi:hypothetical protein